LRSIEERTKYPYWHTWSTKYPYWHTWSTKNPYWHSWSPNGYQPRVFTTFLS